MTTFPTILRHAPRPWGKWSLVSLRRQMLAAVAAAAIVAAPAPANAQMPGVPVLQSAFANPGITLAVNVGYARNALGYGLAGAWAPGTARYVLSAGAGAYDVNEAGSAASGGARVSVPLTTYWEGALGVAAFAGAGGARREEWNQLDVAAGFGLAWRREYGVGRGVSLHTAPMARWMRNYVEGGSSTSAVLFRVSAGVDFTITRSIGATLGFETGQTRLDASPGLDRSLAGVGVSYVFR
ncbi:MAG TPA: hypothetical protein VMM18_06130 [Gemmatimonadaceae bacterium]|nr:hypothetical protein [Gemmatimonadaceae bacterium]